MTRRTGAAGTAFVAALRPTCRGRAAAAGRSRRTERPSPAVRPRVASLAEPQIRTLVSRTTSMALENLAGRSIAGYRLLERVGEGETAEVYRAEHRERGACAFKGLRGRLRGAAVAAERLLRGTGCGARLPAPGVDRS